MSQPIYYDSSEVGAPSLNNAAGSLIEVLRACLANGFNAKAISSISVAAGVATATCASHGFSTKKAKLVQISGAAEAGLNGNKQPLTADTNTFTFDATGVADGTYSGAITARRAPLGWVELFTDANVSVFKRSAPEANAQMLLINDSHANGSTATDARVQIIEEATSATAVTGAYPATAGYWTKGVNSATAKQWALVGDDRLFWLFTSIVAPTSPYTLTANYFGDLVSYFSPDAYSTVLAHATAGSSSALGGYNAYVEGGSIAGLAVSRDLGSTAGRNYVQVAPRSNAPSTAIGGQKTLISSASLVFHEPVWAVESDGVFRGEVPGVAVPLASTPFNNTVNQLLVREPSSLSATHFLIVLHAVPGSNGVMLINLSQWRR